MLITVAIHNAFNIAIIVYADAIPYWYRGVFMRGENIPELFFTSMASLSSFPGLLRGEKMSVDVI